MYILKLLIFKCNNCDIIRYLVFENFKDVWIIYYDEINKKKDI